MKCPGRITMDGEGGPLGVDRMLPSFVEYVSKFPYIIAVFYCIVMS